jgi:hypothetical protein
VANGDKVVLTDENAGLAKGDPAFLQRRRAQHDEQRFAVDLQPGHLMRVHRVLDRELV